MKFSPKNLVIKLQLSPLTNDIVLDTAIKIEVYENKEIQIAKGSVFKSSHRYAYVFGSKGIHLHILYQYLKEKGYCYEFNDKDNEAILKEIALNTFGMSNIQFQIFKLMVKFDKRG